jgi:hypothetical protein
MTFLCKKKNIIARSKDLKPDGLIHNILSGEDNWAETSKEGYDSKKASFANDHIVT